MNRQDLVNLLVTRGAATPLRLHTKSMKELEEMLDQSLLAGIRAEVAQSPEVLEMQQRAQQRADKNNAEHIWNVFFLRHPELKDTQANRLMLFNYALSLSEDEVVKSEHLEEAASLPGLDRQRVRQEPTAANLAQDEETLQKFCKVNRLAMSAAALNVLRHQFGASFDGAQITQALQTGAIVLGPASAEQLRQWSSEAQAEREDYLLNQASPLELRAAANAETEQRRVQVQQQEQQRQIAERAKTDANQGYVPLPEFNSQGVKIDAIFLKNLERDVYRNYIHRYGATALTERLNGIK